MRFLVTSITSSTKRLVLYLGEHNWRKQAMTQVCAFYSPFARILRRNFSPATNPTSPPEGLPSPSYVAHEGTRLMTRCLHTKAHSLRWHRKRFRRLFLR